MDRQTDISPGAFDRARDVYGAKLLILFGTRMPVILRDNRSDIPDPNKLDLPGGGREAGESAVECVLRETREELSLGLAPRDLHYGRAYRNGAGREVWFFAAHLDYARLDEIALGDEGQSWHLMQMAEYLSHASGIVAFQDRLADYLAWAGARVPPR
ncbi:NUDIX domain-containing protein [Pseudooceanicola sediminis]|uniref:NUDIX domain-containing protein n=1 Tax=Pseudooceanicola sediminis TaxID=2211117 RepID=A0A399J3P9_9RHOB|nr:NUDIX hydrolase [Pseudooceanicola sediminis]KAA2312568.1 NUDIX domain-containing protein [Puniceibacterium sp. HSS470]RII37576.1 NUDIX domain-containing protein [Pseudooceanicola sediminis]|tara:strand:- start:9720 stop:10190 length:471 start_codon:yes stop_codon:yes gene_type:complete